MKLQLALDVLTLQDALSLARAVEDCVDRFEMGTPFLLEYGMEAVRRFRAAFPDKEAIKYTDRPYRRRRRSWRTPRSWTPAP